MDQKYIIERLRSYVDMPSGSYDLEGLNAFVECVAQDMEALGMQVVRHPAENTAPTLECSIGEGENTLLLIGHMDTVFPREELVTLSVDEDIVRGSGVMDMKGGLLIMQEALRRVIPTMPENTHIVCLLNPDEETGSETSNVLVTEKAGEAFACLSFEPMRESGAVIKQRKGVFSFEVRCTGVRGHAGSKYLVCASAIQQLCHVIERLYTLRNDEKEISINVGVIRGGSAENVVADEAVALAEIRCYDPAYMPGLIDAVKAICQEEGVPGTTTTMTIHASHPPFKANDKCLRLVALAQEIAKEQGRELPVESTGGAGDISFASKAGIAALDGLGLLGYQAHTMQEHGLLSSFERNVDLSAELMRRLLENPEVVK